MAETAPQETTSVRALANAYVDALAELDPLLATTLGRPSDRLPDLSPDGHQARDDLARSTLARLDGVEPADEDERRCARLLRERLAANLALSEAGEHLRDIRSIFSPVHRARVAFQLMPTATEEDWAVIARRMAAVPRAVGDFRLSLDEGVRGGLFAAPRQVSTFVEQLDEWLAGRGWFAGFTEGARVPPALRAELDTGATAATSAVAELRRDLAERYLPRAEGTPDAVGADRYLAWARYWTGADLDLAETYAWGWAEFQRLRAEMHEQAQRVLPGASTLEATRHLDEHGEAVEGEEEIRRWLQRLMDGAIADLDGDHFDLTDAMKRVESRIAPPGSAAAPYYTRPAQDLSRPGRTWLPTLGRTRFPVWDLVSTWYHEGVPGHHLQFAEWARISGRLSTFQTSVGSVSACSEGWALYAERLMDELGYFTDPGTRLGYLDQQLLRAIRVVIDIGMHLRLEVPGDSPLGAGESWTPELALEFLQAHSGRNADFLESEIVRYLGGPGQAISYKLGERAWLAGREAARATRGDAFDLKSWHMAALSLGALGLDDLTPELARL
ncbi:DUF885 domain-containing protein [Amycolatopsis anabasis]|uniref:DUF885 domain-containing protein n=1 Tax=Amycolatopsis anabasis TaxID=1840409 RepID=UPI00131E9F97|nr:DUF885 domain-containing protein [Amycolatopsis anabasis]